MRLTKALAVVCSCILLTPTLGLCVAKKKIIPPVEGIEWWKTKEGCEKASTRVGYVPRTTSLNPVPSDLVPGKLGKAICTRTTLPELGKSFKGYVWQPVGTNEWFRKGSVSGVLTPVLMIGCLNSLEDTVELPDLVTVTTVKGDKGDKGDSGARGDIGASGADGKSVSDEELRLRITEALTVPKAGETTGSVMTTTTGETPKKPGMSGKKKAVIIGLVVLGVAGGGYAASQRGGNNNRNVCAASSLGPQCPTGFVP